MNLFITRCRSDGPRGGVGLFIRDNIKYKIREDLGFFIPHVIETIFVEIINPRTIFLFWVLFIDQTLNQMRMLIYFP